MATDANVNIWVDDEIKDKAQQVFSALGLDMASAINVFLRQAINHNGIPFELTADNGGFKRKKPPQFGCLKGRLWEADDHDWFEPMEEFKEYM